MTVPTVHDIITQPDIINAPFFDLQLMTDVGIPKEFAEECPRHESNKLLYIMYKEEANLTCKVSMYCKKSLYTGQFSLHYQRPFRVIQ